MVCHAVVKRAYVELRERAPYLKRLALWTIRAEDAAQAGELFHLPGSKPVFEIYQEAYEPPLNDLFERLTDS
jgi:hypothetical protein